MTLYKIVYVKKESAPLSITKPCLLLVSRVTMEFLPLGLDELGVLLRVWLDEDAGPVPLGLEEERVRAVHAVSGATLDEESVTQPTQDLVHDQRLVLLPGHRLLARFLLQRGN